MWKAIKWPNLIELDQLSELFYPFCYTTKIASVSFHSNLLKLRRADSVQTFSPNPYPESWTRFSRGTYAHPPTLIGILNPQVNMTFLSLIPSSARKVKSSPFLPSLRQKVKHGDRERLSLIIHLHDALAVNRALLADGPGTRFKMPWPESHNTSQSRAGKHRSIIHRSTHA